MEMKETTERTPSAISTAIEKAVGEVRERAGKRYKEYEKQRVKLTKAAVKERERQKKAGNEKIELLEKERKKSAQGEYNFLRAKSRHIDKMKRFDWAHKQEMTTLKNEYVSDVNAIICEIGERYALKPDYLRLIFGEL